MFQDYDTTIANLLSPKPEQKLSRVDQILNDFDVEKECMKIDFWFFHAIFDGKMAQVRARA
jgi:hypothetical protein